MERHEAEAIYAAGREAVVEVLLGMDRQIQTLTERVERLERELAKNSKNSSRPPSSDSSSVKKRGKPARPKGPSGKSQGAQPGHGGKGRELLPSWACDEVVQYWPERCRCGHAFCESERVAMGDPVRHQVEELPQISTIVVEHQCPRVRCPGCGRRQRAQLPTEIAASAFGSRLQAAIATVSVRNRISRRDAVELVEQLFGARISTGTIDAILARAADALADPYEDLLDRVRAAGAINMDETGWRLQGAQRTLWGAFTERHAVLQVTDSRHEEHARAILGDTTAVVCSDRWWAYSHLALARRQICWSHLQRDFQAQFEGIGAEHELGQVGLEICDQLFFAWEAFQHTGDRRQLTRVIRRLQRRLKPILRTYAGKKPRYKRTRGLAKNLLKIWAALWTFAKVKSVTPTNNHAERGLRGAVIYRKLSLGSQSADGETRIARLLSAHTTCRLQARSLFDYLAEVLTHHARGASVPLLA
ncbi:MAG TPA: IS66 family transposase [Polyangia bacterium]|nr:IS66 family transposase [Polyangia bacterium]